MHDLYYCHVIEEDDVLRLKVPITMRRDVCDVRDDGTLGALHSRTGQRERARNR